MMEVYEVKRWERHGGKVALVSAAAFMLFLVGTLLLTKADADSTMNASEEKWFWLFVVIFLLCLVGVVAGLMAQSRAEEKTRQQELGEPYPRPAQITRYLTASDGDALAVAIDQVAERHGRRTHMITPIEATNESTAIVVFT
jgi:uncharacterized membrane protein YidH (DUF202 family)